jgi:hypothetical protein
MSLGEISEFWESSNRISIPVNEIGEPPLTFWWIYADVRCVQVNLPAEGRDDPAAWPEVVNKIKESVVLAFDAAIVEREEEVKRGEAQRMMVGWNFCTWFLLKVSQLIYMY